MAMAEVGATPGGGNNRPALSDLDAQGRELLISWARQAGCTPRVDAIGNLFLRRPGTADRSPILIGSHLDTQPTGGRFDGVYGVLGGLEILTTFAEGRIEHERPIDLAVWTNEEGARFERSMMGSAVWSTALDLDAARALVDQDGTSVGEELDRLGWSSGPMDTERPAAAFELHIEQGPILERQGQDIGVVTGVLGIRQLAVQLTGEAAHAGPTPMVGRRDPVRGLVQIAAAIFETCEQMGEHARATLTSLSSSPLSRNTVQETSGFVADIRHEDPLRLDDFEGLVRRAIDRASAELRLDSAITVVNESRAVTFDERLVSIVREAAECLGLRHQDMVSGAGHDSCYVSRVTPTAMIFVPCAGGISHNEAESMSEEAARNGADVLLQAALQAATS